MHCLKLILQFKQEIIEKEYSELSEDEKKFYQRNLTKKGNYSLNQAAKKAGVKNYDRFHNYGYRGYIMEKLLTILLKEKNC